MKSFPSRRDTLAKIFIMALLPSWAVIGVNCEILVPRQGWSEKWGPMVPHQTFPGDCGICHVPERWDVLKEDFSFDHEQETGYPLTGAHARAVCLRCHNDRGPVEAYASRGCAGCHVDPHQSTLGPDCLRCHDEENWRPGGIVADHARTRFPLVGTHAVTPCVSCHLRAPVGEFRGTPTECSLCHQDDLARATSPDHVANGWTTNCQRCHAATGWSGASFSHDFFPLVGGHAGRECRDCHTGGRFVAIPSDCVSCHLDDYQTAPGHVAQGFSQNCTRCHTTFGWTGANFNHDFFPLVGGHAGLECIRCHTSGTFVKISSNCFSCHQDDYQRAPDHAALQFPTDCTRCHTINAWRPANKK